MMKATVGGVRLPSLPAPLVLAVLLLYLAACTPHTKLYPKIDGLARQGKFLEAAKLVEESKDIYDERNEVLYNLDRGLLYHYGKNYKASNEAFEEAERRMDELFITSIASNVGAFLVNDNTLAYRGEDFESVVVNIYRALNYVMLGQIDSALVEARKVNEKLQFINTKYDPDKRNVYKEDGFARLLTGILYELGGTRADANDAFIANRNAVGNYRDDFTPQYGFGAPTLLKSGLLTTAAFMGREELGLARKAFPDIELLSLRDLRKKGRLYFIHFAGRSPIKVEDAIQQLLPDGYTIRIVFPKYQPRSYTVHGSAILVNGEAAVRLEPAEPIGPIAIKNLDNRKLRVAVKAIARATTKYLATKVAQKAVEEEKGAAAGLLTMFAGNVAAAATEQADLRAWQTLPDKILVGRVVLEPGKYDLGAQYLSSTGGVVATEELGEVEIKAGQARFFILHSNY